MTNDEILNLARDCRLWLDEDGTPRILHKDRWTGRSRVGRRVAKKKVQALVDAGSLYYGTNSTTFTHLHPA